MPRRNFNDGQEIVFGDLNKITSAIERGLYDRFFLKMLQGKKDAFFDTSFLPSFSSSTSITVGAGLGIQEDSSQTSPEPTIRPLYLGSAETVNIGVPDAALDRIDIVVVQAALANELTENRKFKAAISGTISTESLVTQKDWTPTISVVAGTPDASPSAPATPAGFIKIAELYVTAVTGMSGSGAVTDSRSLLPIAGEVLINTLGFDRLTAAAETDLDTLFAEIDDFLQFGSPEYLDFVDQVSDPAAPGSSTLQRVYQIGGNFFVRNSVGAIKPFGAGGGGGGGLKWNPVPGSEPIEEDEFGEKVFKFADSGGQSLQVYLKVPNSYAAGQPIAMNLAIYSPSTSGNIKMRTVASLIRKNVDNVDSTTNQRTSTNAEITAGSPSNEYREINVDLTSSTGTINSVAVSPGDLIKVELDRDTGGESSSDSAETRFIPSATEATFQ